MYAIIVNKNMSHKNMLYGGGVICDACRYQFEQKNQPDRCPDCGKEQVREANEQETAEYIKLQKEMRGE